MKKVINVLLMLLVFISVYMSIQFFSVIQFYSTFEDTNESVILIEDVSCSIDEFIDIVYDLSEEYETVLYMEDTIYQSGESYKRIYTTDATFSGNLDIVSGTLEPGDEYGYLVPSTEKTEGEDQAGTYKSFGNYVNYEIRMMDSLVNTSPIGNLYILSTDDEIVNSIYEDLTNATGIQAKIVETDGFLNINATFTVYFIYFSIFILILLLICNTYFIISQRKAISVKRMYGYSVKDIVCEQYFSYLKKFILITTIVFVISMLYMMFCGWYYLPQYSLYFLRIGAILTIIISILFWISLSTIYFMKDFQSVKNKGSYKFINSFNYIFKVGFLILLITLTTMTLQNIKIYYDQLSEYENWEEVSDYYTMPVKIKTDTDYGSVLPIHKKLTEFYLAQEDVVLIDSSLYHQYSVDEPMTYEMNGGNEPYLSGKQSIIINENFLELQPVYDTEGNLVSVNNDDPYTLTILVPEMYKPYEDEIYEEYLDFFYFHAVKIYNSDAVALGLPSRDVGMEDLAIEIIYIEDNQSVYSYNLNANISNDNYITNAVMVIDNGTFDYTQYMKYISNGYAFFYIDNTENPYSEIEDEVAQYDLEANLRQVVPKSDEVKESMNELKVSILTDSVKLGILIISEIILIWFIVKTYISSKLKELAVKRMHGYGFIQLFSGLLMANVIAYLIVFVLTRGYGISLIILLIDFICLIIAFKILMNKTIINEVKGKS